MNTVQFTINTNNQQLSNNPTHKLEHNSIYTPFINHVLEDAYTNSTSNAVSIIVTGESNGSLKAEFYTNLPLLTGRENLIKIPNKVEYAIRRLLGKKVLKVIHPDIDVAVELCLLFLSQLTSTYFGFKDGSNKEGWKSLRAEYLRELLRYENDTYKKVREALETKLFDGPIIECDYYAERWEKCYYFRLGSNYMGKGISTYKLTTSEVKDLNLKNKQRLYKEASTNTIAQNLFLIYNMIHLPTEEEVICFSKKLVKEDFITKKGKKLTFLNKHPKSYFNNPGERSFVEDNIEIYNYLTRDGLMIPRIGNNNSGGRVTDSFTLMPSYIRNMLKIEGKSIVDVDYSCLHPNLAISLYGGSTKYLTHQKVAEETGIDLSVIKKEHLSFFNKHPEQMKDSPLFTYYKEKEPKMMNNIIDEKYRSKRRHRTTSGKMMKKEVEIVTDVIKVLSNEGIQVGYVYDALFCKPEHAERVKEVMDVQVKNNGVMTNAKITYPQVY
ncbi:MAG: hypothetical protein FJY21_10790 [Bacteroidetes bacterium]|nr:hypothetical protein [Bacteroidota bacterium]